MSMWLCSYHICLWAQSLTTSSATSKSWGAVSPVKVSMCGVILIRTHGFACAFRCSRIPMKSSFMAMPTRTGFVRSPTLRWASLCLKIGLISIWSQHAIELPIPAQGSCLTCNACIKLTGSCLLPTWCHIVAITLWCWGDTTVIASSITITKYCLPQVGFWCSLDTDGCEAAAMTDVNNVSNAAVYALVNKSNTVRLS